ncbi:hypothetical protein GCM10027168_47610 [Streptomyces capparidis]
MHTFDIPSRSPYPAAIPAMRPPQEVQERRSSTPIYDALYSEYRRLFRALPGDRSGEEELRFTGFGPPQPQPHPSWGEDQRRGGQPALPPGTHDGGHAGRPHGA